MSTRVAILGWRQARPKVCICTGNELHALLPLNFNRSQPVSSAHCAQSTNTHTLSSPISLLHWTSSSKHILYATTTKWHRSRSTPVIDRLEKRIAYALCSNELDQQSTKYKHWSIKLLVTGSHLLRSSSSTASFRSVNSNMMELFTFHIHYDTTVIGCTFLPSSHP